MEQYFPLILIAVFVVVLFVLPARQRKRVQAQAQAMQESLIPGTPVMTTSGIHARVAALGETTVDLEIAPGVVSTFERRAIIQVRPTPAPGSADGTSPAPGDDATGGSGSTGITGPAH